MADVYLIQSFTTRKNISQSKMAEDDMPKANEQKKKKYKIAFPKQIIKLANADKGFHEHWEPDRDMLNLPHPFRAIIAAPPHSGKSTVIKNILLRADPPFKKIVIVHCDPENTAEYEDIDKVELVAHVPMPDEWDGETKTLCIIDDIELKILSNEQKTALSRLFGYVSTHKDTSVCLTSQDPYQIPSICRRSANVFILWKLVDLNALVMTARKTGYSAEDYRYFFTCLAKNRHDSIWIDMTENSPYPLRLNGYIPILDYPSKRKDEALKHEFDTEEKPKVETEFEAGRNLEQNSKKRKRV